eukprot:5300661-Pleurochrysis_carterae.AAC.1
MNSRNPQISRRTLASGYLDDALDAGTPRSVSPRRALYSGITSSTGNDLRLKVESHASSTEQHSYSTMLPCLKSIRDHPPGSHPQSPRCSASAIDAQLEQQHQVECSQRDRMTTVEGEEGGDHQWTNAWYSSEQMPPWATCQANFGTTEYDKPVNERCAPPIVPPSYWPARCKEAQRHNADQRIWQTHHASTHCETQYRY